MHIEKYKAKQVSSLTAHDERSCEYHSNEKIDPDKSRLNYNFINEDSLNRYNQIMSEVSCLKRDDVNTLVSIAITLPDKVPAERSTEFFKHCFDFLTERYGKHNNLVSAWVHKDESSDHLHFKFVPVYWNAKKQKKSVSFDKVMPRKEYQSIHKDLEKFIRDKMRIEQAILNGATANGNRTITELKMDSLIQEKNQLEIQVQSIENKLNEFRSATNKIEIKKVRNAPAPEVKKIPLFQEEYVKKSQYDQLAKNYNKINNERIDFANANQAAEAQIKALERQNKTLGSSTLVKEKKQLESENLKLRSELIITRSDLEQAVTHLKWYEAFYQAVLKSFKELLPNALESILKYLPEQHRHKIQRDLKPQPSRSIEFDR